MWFYFELYKFRIFLKFIWQELSKNVKFYFKNHGSNIKINRNVFPGLNQIKKL